MESRGGERRGEERRGGERIEFPHVFTSVPFRIKQTVTVLLLNKANLQFKNNNSWNELVSGQTRQMTNENRWINR